jgi:hypothetical protein
VRSALPAYFFDEILSSSSSSFDSKLPILRHVLHAAGGRSSPKIRCRLASLELSNVHPTFAPLRDLHPCWIIALSRRNRNHFVNVSRTLEQTPSASDRWPRALHVDARVLVPGWTGSLRPKACPFDLGPTARTGQTGAEKDPVKSLLTLSRTSFPHGRPHVDQCKSTKCGRRPPYYPQDGRAARLPAAGSFATTP